MLVVAVEAFNEFGYDATSIGTLAARLGTSKAAIYHHFSSKEELLELALDEALTALEGVLGDEQADEGTASDRLALVVRGAVHVLVNKLPYVTLLLRVRGNSDVERNALERRKNFDRAVTQLLSEARAEGSIRSDLDPSVAERLLFGMINSIVEWYKPKSPEDAARLADDVIAVAFDGLRVPR
ncbi:TetR/AcrR family transcriptional regulator [Klugiella xanthotipulae]